MQLEGEDWDRFLKEELITLDDDYHWGTDSERK